MPPAAICRIRVVVANHERTRQAIELKAAFAPHAEVVAIDSGSRLSPAEAPAFDQCLPNVYYTGLWNAAVEACRDLGGDDLLYFVCSDVAIPDAARAIERVRRAFADPGVGVYGASATGTSFQSMRNKGTGGLRDLAFIDGFCFAARLSLLRAIAPVDAGVNRLGWGIDLYLALKARLAGLRCVVDDGIEVAHDFGSGYSQDEALSQFRAWLQTLPPRARRGVRWIFRSYAQTPLGVWSLRLTPWRLLFA